MKKHFTRFLVAMSLLFLLSSNSFAFSSADLNDENYFLLNGFSSVVGTDTLVGYMSVAQIQPALIFSADNGGIPLFPANWQLGDSGEYLYIAFGGITGNLMTGWDTTGSWASLYSVSSDISASLFAAGPANFMTTLLAASPTLLADFVFNSYSTLIADADSVTVKAFLNVTGGPLANAMDSDYFTGMTDVILGGNTDALVPPQNGWAAVSQTNYAYMKANVVPEPATVMLLGMGLLGLAAAARKARK